MPQQQGVRGGGESAERRGGNIRRIAKAIVRPSEAVRSLALHLPGGSMELRSDLDLYARPHYAYCVLQAARLAQRLGLPAISVAELGVAGGNGLIEMESMASLASEVTGVRIEVYGFDLGSGLPEPLDYRDLPYYWEAGFFAMDIPALESALTSSRLVLGDLAETVPEFNSRRDIAPLGFLAIDVDFYSAAAAGLGLFDAPDGRLLPRVLVYLDDIVGDDYALHNEYVGELAAVREYNEAHTGRKITKVAGLIHTRIRKAEWCDSIFALHIFEHPLYDTYVGPPASRQQRPLA